VKFINMLSRQQTIRQKAVILSAAAGEEESGIAEAFGFELSGIRPQSISAQICCMDKFVLFRPADGL